MLHFGYQSANAWHARSIIIKEGTIKHLRHTELRSVEELRALTPDNNNTGVCAKLWPRRFFTYAADYSAAHNRLLQG